MFEQSFGHISRGTIQERKKGAHGKVRRHREPWHFERKLQLAIVGTVPWDISGEQG